MEWTLEPGWWELFYKKAEVKFRASNPGFRGKISVSSLTEECGIKSESAITKAKAPGASLKSRKGVSEEHLALMARYIDFVRDGFPDIKAFVSYVNRPPLPAWFEVANRRTQAWHLLGVTVPHELMTDSFITGLHKRDTFVMGSIVELLGFGKYPGVDPRTIRITCAFNGDYIDHFPLMVREALPAITEQATAYAMAEADAARDAEKRAEVLDRFRKDGLPRKVFFCGYSGGIVDIGGDVTVDAYKATWLTWLSVQSKRDALKTWMTSAGHALNTVPVRLDATFLIVSSDRKLLLGLRSKKANDDADRWSVIGENIQWDNDAVDNVIDLDKVIVRALHADKDETTFRIEDVEAATKKCVALALQWNLMISNLLLVLDFAQSHVVLNDKLPDIGEHQAFDWVPLEIEPILDLIVLAQYAKGTDPAKEISAFGRYAMYVALCHFHGRSEVDEHIARRAGLGGRTGGR